MKKKGKTTKSQSTNLLASSSGSGTCVYQCMSGNWYLVEDYHEPGYYCDDTYGECTEEEEGMYIEVDATEDPGDDGGGGDDPGDGGGAPEMLFATAARTRSAAAKNTAIYEYRPSKKTLRRIRGSWASGHYAPREMTMNDLAKFAPKVYEIVNAMVKNKAVTSFTVLVPTQPRPIKKKPASSAIAKKGSPKKPSAKKAVAKKTSNRSSPKLASKKGSSKKA